MTKIFAEADITIETLDAHVRDSGFVPYNVQEDAIQLRTENGIGYRISLLAERKFIRMGTYLPLNRQAPVDQKHALAKRLNEEVFLAVFTVDQDEDLSVAYVLPYAHGLIAGNFVSVVTRFASLLEYIVRACNDDGLIDFDTASDVVDSESGASGELLH